MKKDELVSALQKVLFDDWGPTPTRKAQIVLSLCGFYSPDGIPENLQSEVSRLSSQLLTLQAFEKLLEALERGRFNDFRWDPHFHPEHVPNQITMNPTFNIQRSDDASLVAETVIYEYLKARK
ncbi:TPA: hypothetical protein EYP66_08210 [Candidatus Poribacteria bacterium]|nr:hypothetical protein [Candidatus Poribacteria bacterium]